jgi:hypothetical protein
MPKNRMNGPDFTRDYHRGSGRALGTRKTPGVGKRIKPRTDYEIWLEEQRRLAAKERAAKERLDAAKRRRGKKKDVLTELLASQMRRNRRKA